MAHLRVTSPRGRLLWNTEARRLLRLIWREDFEGRVDKLAEHMGVHRSDVSRWLEGLTRPSMPEAFLACQALGIPLLAWTAEPCADVHACTRIDATVEGYPHDAA